MGSNILKYVFGVIVIILIGIGIFAMNKSKNKENEENMDQTSTTSTIQTDLRLAICNLDTMNPILSNNRNVQQITKIIYDPLVTLTDKYKIQYCLADEIAKTDDLNYVIKLKEGILWQDGTEFTANDVKFTVDTIKGGGINSIYSSNLQSVTGLEVVDDNTLKVTLSHPVDFFEYNLTFPILSQKYYEGEDFKTTEKNNAPIGTGMFKIASVDSNVIRLEKNDSYWNKDSRDSMVKEISINLYNSAGELYNSFKNGELDIIDVRINNVEDYIGSMGYKKIEYKARDYAFITLNTQSEIFSNKAVRQAISKALDKNNIVASCLGTGYSSSNFSLDMGNWLYTKDLTVQTNTDEAKQILIIDGWEYKNNKWTKKIDKKTVELTFTLAVCSSNPQRVAVAENIQSQLANLGIKVTIKQLNDDAYNATMNDRSFDAAIMGIECGYSPNLNTFFGENNIANFSNDSLNELMKAVSNTKSEDELYKNYAKIYDIYLDEVPYIGLYRNTDSVIYNQGLVGNIHANCFNLYYNIEKWYRQ